MSVIISDEILQSTRLTAEEMRQEIAVLLFQREKLSLGQASRLAELPQWQFQALLASRQIPLHYDTSDFEADVQTLRDIGRL